MKNIFLSSLSKAINSYLDLDPESRQRVNKLRGKAITFELLPLHFKFHCFFSEHGMDLSLDENIQSETLLRGTPLQMLAVMINKDNRQRFFAEDIVIEGNAELGQQVIELFDHLQIDWEEHFSKLIGDVPAYHAKRALKQFTSWLSDTEKSVSQNINEYLHEETNWLPSREALEDFFTEIDTMRMDVDRVEARVKTLSAIINEEEVE